MPDTVRWPLESNVIRRNDVRNTYGPVRREADGSPRNHQGWDFFAAEGTRCFAIADGKIMFAENAGADGYGLTVVQSFTWNQATLYAAYAHLSQIDVAVGDVVTIGQQIGLTGNSGNARGMTGMDQHLHFEIRTIVRPGRGLAGRMTPLTIFGELPLKTPILDPV